MFFCLYLFNYLIFNYLIHSESHDLLVLAQGVDQVCQGVVGRIPRKADHSAGHSVKARYCPKKCVKIICAKIYFF